MADELRYGPDTERQAYMVAIRRESLVLERAGLSLRQAEIDAELTELALCATLFKKLLSRSKRYVHIHIVPHKSKAPGNTWDTDEDIESATDGGMPSGKTAIIGVVV